MLALAVCLQMAAEKTVYIPASWSYNATTQEYTEGGNPDLQWSYNRSKESENCIIFWQKGFGSDPSKAPRLKGVDMTVDVDAVLRVAEKCYELNVNTLGFASSNMLHKYKIIILMNYTAEWTCYGGGYDFRCSALWLNPATVKPAGHSLAHEVGHSFHYMSYAQASNYNPNSSATINTGFHLACGNGQAIWEQTAQWQANQAFPEEMFNQSIGVFRKSHNYAFSHEWHRYQSYWFHYYLCQHYNDITTVAQVWNTPMTGQTNGNASDFNQALMKLKGLDAEGLFRLYYDYAAHCATWDFDACKAYRNNYIGDFDYQCVMTGDREYQVALSSTPQSSGFNVIPLQVPAAGTTVTTHFTALRATGVKLAPGDPAEMMNGETAWSKTNRTTYINNSNRSNRGFRLGYVALMKDGSRRYFNDDTVYCTGSTETSDDVSMTVPEGVSRLWLIVVPAPKKYVQHKWTEKADNAEQWPYSFRLEGTDIGPRATVYVEPVIDGRPVGDVTLTYDISFPATTGANYQGTSLSVGGQALATMGTALQLRPADLAGMMQQYSAAGPSVGKVMFYPCNPANGTIVKSGSTANGYGHWFGANGAVTAYSSGYVYSEFTPSSLTFVFGPYPGKTKNGSDYTVSQALLYKKSATETATARFVFNIHIKSGTPTATLTSVAYADPTTAVTPATVRRSYAAPLYDLQGRRVTTPRHHGLYVMNGKKVVL